MGVCREKRPSEKTLDTVFSVIRSIDVEIWTGEKYRVHDVEENVSLVKRYLDELVNQFKQEVGYTNSAVKPVEVPNVKPWVEPVFKKKEWYSTPLVPETKKTEEK